MSDLRPNWRKTLTLRPEPAVIFIETGEQKEELTMGGPSDQRGGGESLHVAESESCCPIPGCVRRQTYVGGDVIEVPNDPERDTWLKAGWVELVKEK